MNEVEPVPGPALSVPRRGEEFVYEFLVGAGRRIANKGVNGLQSWRQPGQIKRQTTDERRTARLRGRP